MITGMPRIAIAVRDLDRAMNVFHTGFEMPVAEVPGAAGSLGVRIAMCTPDEGSNMELMAPAVATAPLNQSLEKFLDRRGEGLFALMLEAPDPNAEAEVLAARGLQILPLMPGAGGRDVHPLATHGVLVRVYPTRPPRETGSAPLTGIVRVIVAVQAFDDAVMVYRDRFALPVNVAPPDAERGVRAAYCRPGSGGVIELVSPTDTSRPFARAIAASLKRRGEGMYALVHQAEDPAAVAAALRANGIAVQPSTDIPEVMEVEPAATFGALLRIEPRRLPTDEREAAGSQPADVRAG